MHIALYTPFKPLGHKRPSGDLVIATGLLEYLTSKGHTVWQAGPLRARWIYWKPWAWFRLIRVYEQTYRKVSQERIDLWLTYHAYYKAPDVLGPWASIAGKIPYVIFQGIYSTKRRRHPLTWPGFVLNRTSLTAAKHIFSNRREDLHNLKRLIPTERLSYVKPGIYPDAFQFDEAARQNLRQTWGVGDKPVILSAAMFRPDVKTEGLEFLLRACGRLAKTGQSFWLIIAGDGKERQKLERLAHEHVPGQVRFVGKIKREQMAHFYSAGDLFVFPGFRESLGMVYLESQSCGLPVIAFDNGGIPEVVANGQTGFLTPLEQTQPFDNAIQKLLQDKELRRSMGQKAAAHVRQHHDLSRNYGEMEKQLQRISRNHQNA